MTVFTHGISTNNYGPAAIIVDANPANGTHTTIQGAVTAAAANSTIFIRPGTYVENITLASGKNLCAYGCDSSLNGTGHVVISGTITVTTATTCTISGIQLQTNSAALLAVTGSAASVVNLENCYLNCTNNTGITFSSSDASATIRIYRCSGDLGTTGIAYYTHSSSGLLEIGYCRLQNSGASTTANTCSAGSLNIAYCSFNNPLTTSGTASLSQRETSYFMPGNTTCLTSGGSGGSGSIFDTYISGTASAISVGNTLTLFFANVNSSNTNAITGAGTLNYNCLTLPVSTSINTTTQVGGTLQGGVAQAPSAGFLGEQIRSFIGSGSAVNLPNNTATNITSISLTAGIWDVSGLISVTTTGVFVVASGGVSTVSATLGSNGDNKTTFQLAGTAVIIDLTIPSYRITITSTTTVYLIGFSNFNTGTSAGYGRISATRVG